MSPRHVAALKAEKVGPLLRGRGRGKIVQLISDLPRESGKPDPIAALLG